MRILKVIHGYPMRFNAGSEVYSQTLCHGLADHHEVHVFTREEDIFKDAHVMHVEEDSSDPRVLLHIINQRKNQLLYQDSFVDKKFADLVKYLRPDIIHVGHLSHLSTSLLESINQDNVPIIYTLHDYWLMCPRGQFIQKASSPILQLCEGQDNRKCAQQCYKGYFSGDKAEEEKETAYWIEWVEKRMSHIRKVASRVDQFIAPSRYLLNRYRNDFGLEADKLTYLDYGFNLERLKGRQRIAGQEPFVFGYIGTHIPSKGIQDLIRAFGQLNTPSILRIWGREREETAALKGLAASLLNDKKNFIEWYPEYNNHNIVQNVFNHVDAIVVPSIWVENSPLVIHEALQLRVPVITADAGGMSEYVHHEKNGLLFQHRNISSLAQQMERLAENPDRAIQLGSRGYLQSESGNIPEIEEHVKQIEKIYQQALAAKKYKVSKKNGPWRITFDTNPDHCNYKCVMCECFSPYNKLRKERTKAGIPRRIMDIALIKKILQESKGTPLREIIPSTMGEPLLYKDFEQIVKLCKEYNIKLNLTTNGSFPRKGAELWSRILVPVCSDIKISWNGATKSTQEEIMLGSKWESSINNLKTLITIRDQHAKEDKNHCKITLQLTFLTSNIDELEDIIKLGINLGVDRIKGHHLWAHFEEIKKLSMRKDTASIQKWNDTVTRAHKIAASQLLPNGKHIILENIFQLNENAVEELAPDGICPFLDQEAWVDASGRFNPCCAPDQERLKLGDFGNLNEKSLREIWESIPYKRLQENYMSHPLCKGCNMRKPLVSCSSRSSL